MPFLQLGQQDVYYTWDPVGDGPTILFIHGLGSSSSFYAPITPFLHKHGYSCLAFDTPAPLSTYRGTDSDVQAICGVANALISALGIDARRTIVVGHSMGALVASELALCLDLLGVVLIGPVNPDALADMFAARIRLVQAEAMDVVAKMIPSAATGPKATPTHHAFIRALLLAQSPEGYMSLCRTIRDAKRPRYGEIRCPLLVVAGSHDRTSTPRGLGRFCKAGGAEESKKRLEVLEGVGHWHCIEAADEVGALVKQFADARK